MMLYLCKEERKKKKKKSNARVESGSPEQDLVTSGSERKCLQTCSRNYRILLEIVFI